MSWGQDLWLDDTVFICKKIGVNHKTAWGLHQAADVVAAVPASDCTEAVDLNVWSWVLMGIRAKASCLG